MKKFTTVGLLTRLDANDRVVIATIIISSAVGILALWLGLSMVAIAALTLVPWLPTLAAKLRTDWLKYGWLAIFELLVIFQLAHFAEHVSQMIELHFLDWAPYIARGVVGELDIEPVHFWWNLFILYGAVMLLLRFKHNGWLWASVLFSIWHQVEHTYIYFVWFLPKGVSSHPGIFGAGGLVDAANVYIPFLTTLGRADLHFWYNFFEIGLFTVAFVAQVRSLSRPATPAPVRSGNIDWRKRAVVALALTQIPIVLLFVLFQRSPRNITVPQDYSTLQAAIDAAPEWAIVRVGPGTFQGTVRIDKPVTLVGAGVGATRLESADDTTPAVAIEKTHDVVVKNLTVAGGLYGILAEESIRVQILNTRVESAWFAGIRLSRAAAEITGNTVIGTRGPYGMGIELANTISKPMSLINRNVIANHPHEGLVMHNAMAMIENNTVTGNGLRGISITEMSMATVRSNTVTDNADAGIYVVDSSMAEILGNRIRGVTPGPNGNADGIRAYYYAEVMLGANEIDAGEHPVVSGYQAEIAALH